jgi:hypothetical protein
MPPEQEKVVTAKSATIGLKQPMKRVFNGVSHAYTPELDGSAIGTFRREQS